MRPSPIRTAAGLIATLASLTLTAAACHAQPPQGPVESASDIAFGKRVRAYLLAHPEVLQEVIDKLQARDDAAKAAEARAAVASRRTALERDPRDPVLGNPRGAVTVVEFFDYRCPFCKGAEPEIEKLLADNPDVRLVLKELPILDIEDQSHISEDAARASLAALAQGRFGPVHRALLVQKQLDEKGVLAVLKANGVDLDKAAPVERAAATTALIADVKLLAHALDVDGTPAFEVNGEMISGAQLDLLRAAIAAARKGRP